MVAEQTTKGVKKVTSTYFNNKMMVQAAKEVLYDQQKWGFDVGNTAR